MSSVTHKYNLVRSKIKLYDNKLKEIKEKIEQMNQWNENIFTFDTSVVDEISPYTSEQDDDNYSEENDGIMNPEDFGNDDGYREWTWEA